VVSAIELRDDDGQTYTMRAASDCPHRGARRGVTLRGITPGIIGTLKGSVCLDCNEFVPDKVAVRKRKIGP
jgi:hypothetical protein